MLSMQVESSRDPSLLDSVNELMSWPGTKHSTRSACGVECWGLWCWCGCTSRRSDRGRQSATSLGAFLGIFRNVRSRTGNNGSLGWSVKRWGACQARSRTRTRGGSSPIHCATSLWCPVLSSRRFYSILNRKNSTHHIGRRWLWFPHVGPLSFRN